MTKKQITKKEIEAYIKFLEKAIVSNNLKNNDSVKWEQYKVKLDRERLKLNLLFNKIKKK